MTEYIPTYEHRCEDPECRGYGRPMVDRGYGYPVCETQQWRSEFLGKPNLPMDDFFLKGE